MPPRILDWLSEYRWLIAITIPVVCLIFLAIGQLKDIKTWEAVYVTANILSAFGVLIALVTYFGQTKDRKAQVTYDIFSKQLDNEIRSFEIYIKYQFKTDLGKNAFDFSRGLSSSVGQTVSIRNVADGSLAVYEINYVILKVCYLYNQVGYLALYNAVDTNLIFSGHGADIALIWKNLEKILISHDSVKRPIIAEQVDKLAESEWINIEYLGGFKYLVDLYHRSRPIGRTRRLLKKST